MCWLISVQVSMRGIALDFVLLRIWKSSFILMTANSWCSARGGGAFYHDGQIFADCSDLLERAPTFETQHGFWLCSANLACFRKTASSPCGIIRLARDMRCVCVCVARNSSVVIWPQRLLSPPVCDCTTSRPHKRHRLRTAAVLMMGTHV